MSCEPKVKFCTEILQPRESSPQQKIASKQKYAHITEICEPGKSQRIYSNRNTTQTCSKPCVSHSSLSRSKIPLLPQGPTPHYRLGNTPSTGHGSKEWFLDASRSRSCPSACKGSGFSTSMTGGGRESVHLIHLIHQAGLPKPVCQVSVQTHPSRWGHPWCPPRRRCPSRARRFAPESRSEKMERWGEWDARKETYGPIEPFYRRMFYLQSC